MSRAKRRFEERKRKLKKAKAMWIYYGYRESSWAPSKLLLYWSLPEYLPHDVYREVKLWRPWNNLVMSEAGRHRSWLHPMMVKPWRTNCNRLTRDLTAGRVDPDEVLYPIYCRPWIYYW